MRWPILFLLLLFACSEPIRTVNKAGGVLTITSELPEQAKLFLDGQIIGTISPNETRTYTQLPSGQVLLEAVGEKTGIRQYVELDLTVSTRWSFVPTPEEIEAMRLLPKGAIKVENRTSEPVRVYTDGEPKDMIWPGATAEYGSLEIGKHHLRAEGLKTGFFLEADVVTTAETTPVFVVTAPKGAIRVNNASGLWLRVTLEHISRKTVKQGETALFDNLAVGSYKIAAVDLAGRGVFVSDAHVKAGEVTDVTIPPPSGVLAVVSDFSVPVTITADGRNLGECPAHGAMEFTGLPVGEARVSATGPDGSVVARVRLYVPPTGQASWLLKPGMHKEAFGDEGSVVVLNKTNRPLLLKVDGWYRGMIRPGGKRVVPGLSPGRHLLSALNSSSHDVYHAEIMVPPNGQVSWEVVPALATLRIRNERSEDVRVLIDDSEIGTIATGSSSEFSVAGGRHVVETRGMTTMTGYVQDIDVPARTQLTVVVREPLATLIVTNRFSDPLKISCGERELGVILPGDRVTVRDILPGVMLLNASSLRRPLTWTRTVTLTPGESFSWDIEQ